MIWFDEKGTELKQAVISNKHDSGDYDGSHIYIETTSVSKDNFMTLGLSITKETVGGKDMAKSKISVSYSDEFFRSIFTD